MTTSPNYIRTNTSNNTKLFVGSIPQGTTESMLREEFERFGPVVEIFLKSDNTEEGRMWAFVTYGDSEQARMAAETLHEKLVFPNSSRACAVTIARSSAPAADPAPALTYNLPPTAQADGPNKLFIGTIPERQLRKERREGRPRRRRRRTRHV